MKKLKCWLLTLLCVLMSALCFVGCDLPSLTPLNVSTSNIYGTYQWESAISNGSTIKPGENNVNGPILPNDYLILDIWEGGAILRVNASYSQKLTMAWKKDNNNFCLIAHYSSSNTYYFNGTFNGDKLTIDMILGSPVTITFKKIDSAPEIPQESTVEDSSSSINE